MVTIKDMAKILGISTTTVSNVIHGKTSEVSAETVARVRQLVKDMGYVPNINARNLARNRSKIIGIAVKTSFYKYDNLLKDPFFSELIGAMAKEIRKQGYYLMLYFASSIEEIVHHVAGWNVDGLIVAGLLVDDYMKLKRNYRGTMVLIDCYLPETINNYNNIGLDDEGGSYLITKHLLDNGHRKIGFVADNISGVDYYRYLGHQRALQEYGLPVREENLILIPQGRSRDNSVLKVFAERILDLTAYVFCSDYYAANVINYFNDQGIRIPEEVSITGFDDNEYARMVRPALTTVAQDVTAKAELAVRKLIELLNAEETVDYFDIHMPVELVIRDTVKKLN